MRILVVSDTHGNDSSMRRAILAQPKAEVVIQLGDGEEELLRAKRAFPEKMSRDLISWVMPSAMSEVIWQPSLP